MNNVKLDDLDNKMENTWFSEQFYARTLKSLGMREGIQYFSSQKAQVLVKSQVINVKVQVKLTVFGFCWVKSTVIKFVNWVWLESKSSYWSQNLHL